MLYVDWDRWLADHTGHVTEKHWDGGKMSVQRISTIDWIIVHRLLVSRGEKLFRFLDMNVRL